MGKLAQRLGVKGVHVAERDTQRAKHPKPRNVFVNTWSIEGFVSEGMQPAELGWGTHEKWAPENAGFHTTGCGAAIYVNQPGANTRVRSWTPTARGQFGFLVTHNESISIADYFTVRNEKGEAVYRPTCHYAYHPCDDAVLSLHELFGRAGQAQNAQHILTEAEIVDGIDELGVLLYGHRRNAYWYGSQLSVEETRALAPYQNATGLQVTSAVLAGMVWALENPKAGIVEADELDFRRCLQVQIPYLGPVVGVYTDWTPLQNVRDSSRRTSTRRTPGSSGTCSFASANSGRRRPGRLRRSYSLWSPPPGDWARRGGGVWSRHEYVMNDLAASIRTIPDYPKPGILFRDITTLLGDARAFRRAVDELVQPWAGRKSARWRASRRAALSLAARSRTSFRPASCRFARRASCRTRKSRSPTRSNTAWTRWRCTGTRCSPASG